MNPKYKKLLGEELIKLRKQEGFTLQALSFISNVKEEIISEMEEGKADCSIDEWNSVLSALECRLGIVNVENGKVPDCIQQNTPKKKTVMIIGNGFDMDLGLRTSYKQFANSDLWPFDDSYITPPYAEEAVYSPLAEELNRAKGDNWYDFEEVLRQFGMRAYKDYGNDYPYAEIDRYALELISLSLKKYLLKEMDSFFANPVLIKKSQQSSAKIVMDEIIESGANIYSFNYTDTEKLTYNAITSDPTNKEFYEWCHDNNYFYQIHGTLYSKNIVLGIEEECLVPSNLFFLKKVSQFNFRESSIISDLKEADKVVFFGHSLGNIDACYFKDFFSKISDPNITQGKEILFYTYDESAIQQLKDNIQKMNGGRLLQFTNNNYVEFFMTKR